MYARGQLFKQTQGVLYAWNARENKLEQRDSEFISRDNDDAADDDDEIGSGWGEKIYQTLSSPISN